jgi:hypothetical protein
MKNGRIDITEVKEAAQGRELEILAQVAGIPHDVLDGRHHACPRCGGVDRFRLLDKKAGAVYCNQCFDKHNGDFLSAVQHFRGTTFPESLKLCADHLGVQYNGKPHSEVTDPVEHLARVKRCPVDSLKRFGGKADGRRVVFPVYDQNGQQCSTFTIDPWSNGKAGKGLFAKGKPAGIFLPHDADGNRRLPQPGETWHAAEGLKDPAALDGLGHTAFGLPGRQLGRKFARLFKGVHVVLVPDLDKPSMSGMDKTAARLKGVAASVKIARLPGEIKAKGGGDVRDVLAQQDGERLVRQAIIDAKPWEPMKQEEIDDDGRVVVEVSTAEHETNDAAISVLATDTEVYQRGGVLVRVVQDHNPNDGIIRAEIQPRIAQFPEAVLRERLTRKIRYVAEDKDGPADTHPPRWHIKAVEQRQHWPDVRYLAGVVTHPVLRADGSVLSAPGYDAKTSLIYVPDGEFPPIAERLTQDDAQKAAHLLSDIVVDFPFETRAHRAAWLAYLLTPLGRHAFYGPSPLLLLDANVRGSGKTFLCELVSQICHGCDIARMANPRDDDECRKRITAIAIAGDPLVLIDNVVGSLGCASLDAALTSTKWKDRILGRSEIVELPLAVTWAATGNNVVLTADTTRRVLHIRLESDRENPEERDDFKYLDLRDHVRQHRGELLTAGLVILSAYCQAGRPSQGLKNWGSYEGWSNLVREAVVWCGLPDPGETRQELAEIADCEAGALRDVLETFDQIDTIGDGLLAAEIHARLKAAPDDYTDFRNALIELCPPSRGDLPSARQIGRKFGSLRRRVISGKSLDFRERRGRRRAWRVVQAKTPSGDNGDNGDTVSATPYTCARTRVESSQGSETVTKDTKVTQSSCKNGGSHTWLDSVESGGKTRRFCTVCGKFGGFMRADGVVVQTLEELENARDE